MTGSQEQPQSQDFAKLGDELVEATARENRQLRGRKLDPCATCDDKITASTLPSNVAVAWADCDRDEAIRQAELQWKNANHWLKQHDLRRDERDDAREQVNRLTADLIEVRNQLAGMTKALDAMYEGYRP